MKITRSYGKGGKKQCFQYRCENNDWVLGTKGLERIPYRLPELLAAPTRPIYFVEGEKDADRLAAAGLLATTAPEGAGAQWKPEITKWFKGRDVCILPTKLTASETSRHFLTILGIRLFKRPGRNRLAKRYLSSISASLNAARERKGPSFEFASLGIDKVNARGIYRLPVRDFAS
jgi:hypothetical protein